MLSESPVAEYEACEEWAIHDYENFKGISINEHESLETVSNFAQAIAEHGKAYACYLDNFGVDSASIDAFQESYQGCFQSVEDYVQKYYDDSGLTEKIKEAGLKEYYINWQKIARDWQCGGDISAFKVSSDEVYIFSNH